MRRRVTEAILAGELLPPPDVGSVKDIKAAMGSVPEPKSPSAFVDLDDVMVTTDQAGKLLNLTGLALDRASDILQEFPDRNSETFGDELRAQTSTIKTVLATQLRVDENHLRRRAVDALPELLKAVAAEEKRLSAKGVVLDAIQREMA